MRKKTTTPPNNKLDSNFLLLVFFFESMHIILINCFLFAMWMVISFKSTTSPFAQCSECNKSQPIEYQAAAANEIIIQLKVSQRIEKQIRLLRCKHSNLFPLKYRKKVDNYGFGLFFFAGTQICTLTNTIYHLFCTVLCCYLNEFSFVVFIFIFLILFSTKSEKSVSTNSLASPPNSSSNGAGSMVTQLFPLKLADKQKVSCRSIDVIRF